MKLWNLLLRRFQRRFSSPLVQVRQHRGRPVAARFRPSVLALEDRTVPATDMFADAATNPLSGTFLTATGSNVGATAEMGEPAPTNVSAPSHSVWWQWTAPENGWVEVNTLGSDFDTVLGVWTGTAVDALTLVGGNDQYYDDQSRVIFEAVAGTVYHFSVDGYLGTAGNIVLNLGTAPANDDFAHATAVTFGTYTGGNRAATDETGEPTAAGAGETINSVWWKWETGTTSGRVEINTFGSDLDTLLAVYTGSSLDTLQLVAANDDTAGLQSQVFFEAQANTTYYIAVDGAFQFTGGIVLTLAPSAGGGNSPPVIVDGQTFSLDENSFGGTSVGTVRASDPDRTQTLAYDIIGGNTSDAFSINRETGEIRVQNGAALDYETSPTFNLLVRVTDEGGLSDSAIVTVNLVNLDDAPQFQASGPFTVAENSAAGTTVGTVLATDMDPGQTVSYAITGGNESGAFAIDSATGAITVADPAALDYETTPAFLVRVTATDSGSPARSSSTVVTIFLDNGNDMPVIADRTFDIDENLANGTTVGVAAASDPDGGQTLTYSIAAGNPDGAFAIDSSTGRITVRDSSLLNFETTPTFVLTMRVEDDGSPVLSSTATVTINLRNVNEPATFDEVGPFQVDENAPVGTFVGTVEATDPDADTTLTYSLAVNPNGAFAIDRDTGDITVLNAAALDFERHPSFTLIVHVTDNGTPTISVPTAVVVMLNDVNEAPELDASGAMALAAINQSDFASEGTLVSTLLVSAGANRVTDQDAGAKRGIAVVAADTTYGSWQYSIDGGSTWQALGPVSNGSARLLAADTLTRIRFVPTVGYNGTVSEGITFRAWDQTSGENGGLADASAGGGRSAFSTAVETASIKVLSAVEQIALLSADVRFLVNTGKLSSSDGNQLLTKLNHAKKHLEQGNTTPAENQMTFFINLVSELVQFGDLDPELGEDLIVKARAVIVSIRN